jgi:hypothetical protein
MWWRRLSSLLSRDSSRLFWTAELPEIKSRDESRLSRLDSLRHEG